MQSNLSPAAEQQVRKTPLMPFVCEVLQAPLPVKADGKLRLYYELHITNFRRRAQTLTKVDVFDKENQKVLASYQFEKLQKILVPIGAPGDLKESNQGAEVGSGKRAILFILVSLEKGTPVPRTLIHHLFIKYTRKDGSSIEVQGEGGAVSVLPGNPLLIDPPVRGGMWVVGNGPGDGPKGHRVYGAIQPWNGRALLSQRYAFDYLKLDEAGRLVQGDAGRNSDWSGYGEEIIAVADGIVTDALDGVPENVPLAKERAVEMTLKTAIGNYVIVDLNNGFYAAFCHLKPGSVRVKVGDRVSRGQVLGLLGNSGNSDAPHLHFQVCDANSVFGSEGFPFIHKEFKYLGPFPVDTDEDLLKEWRPQPDAGKIRRLEMPVDGVIRFHYK